MTVPVWSVLGQLIPAAATPTVIYTVARGRQSTAEVLTCCNQGAATTIRVSIRVAGATLHGKQYIYYDLAVEANDTFIHRGPMRLSTSDEVWVESASGGVSFNLFGQEEFV